MKKIIIILVLIVILQLFPIPDDLIFNINNCEAQWVQMSNGIGNKFVYSLDASSTNIFAGTDSYGVYLSTNNGASWTQTGLDGKSILSLVISGNTSDKSEQVIFAGTLYNGVFLSTNNGTNWTQTTLNNKNVYSLASIWNNFDKSEQVIFAGTDYGLYRSTDYGTSWIHTGFFNHVYSFAISMNNSDKSGQIIFAGTNNNGVFLSTNNGLTWIPTSLNNKSVYSLAISGNNSDKSGQIIFAGTDNNGVYFSTNNGQNWTQTTLNNKWIYSLAIIGTYTNNPVQVIFAGTRYYGVYTSTDNGQSWMQWNQGFPYSIPSVYSLLIMGNYIFAGTSTSVWKRPLSDIIGIKNISTKVPSDFALQQNYPNPFNPVTKINFSIPKAEYVKLTIYDALGREIETLVSENLTPGTYQAEWNGSNYASGVYFYRFQAGIYSETKSMMLVK